MSFFIFILISFKMSFNFPYLRSILQEIWIEFFLTVNMYRMLKTNCNTNIFSVTNYQLLLVRSSYIKWFFITNYSMIHYSKNLRLWCSLNAFRQCWKHDNMGERCIPKFMSYMSNWNAYFLLKFQYFCPCFNYFAFLIICLFLL